MMAYHIVRVDYCLFVPNSLVRIAANAEVDYPRFTLSDPTRTYPYLHWHPAKSIAGLIGFFRIIFVIRSNG
ncbi:unnamed protein product [Acanthocheilonema viteae]|uniref:Uncharacterized protein n=1 Tax=Acanthocheilonema viteae TaxID=6277 RepID=A0A498SHM1_ACAVI|nr:unnamed protein product [Acanthocheilonema viteae]